nr:MAG TPA: hypothetical protein [Caudoviricetes sp.]
MFHEYHGYSIFLFLEYVKRKTENNLRVFRILLLTPRTQRAYNKDKQEGVKI